MSGTNEPSSTSSSTQTKTINIKILGVCAVLLLAAMVYNMLGGGARFQHGGGQRYGAAFHEAAIPLQKRPRKSKYDHGADPDSPDTVVIGGAVPTLKPTAPSVAAVSAAAAAAPQSAAAVAASASVAPRGTQAFAASVDTAASALTADLSGLSCHAREGFDIAGDAAYVWGLSFNVGSAAECCAACAAQQKICSQSGSRGKPFWKASRRERTQGRCSGAPGVCNAWVFCPGSDDTRGAEDRCFSYTIHNHTKGECWLKVCMRAPVASPPPSAAGTPTARAPDAFSLF